MNIIKTLWFWLTGQDILNDFEHKAAQYGEAYRRFLQAKEREQ